MYTTSEAYKAAVVQHARTWALDFKLTLDSGEVINLDETKVSLGTTRFKEASTCNDNLQVGSVFANSLNFTMLKQQGFDSKDFSRAIVVAKVGLLVGSSYVWVPLGKFNAVTVGKRTSSIVLECLDDMYKLNRPLSSVAVSFPCSVYALMQNICSGCGVSMTPGTSVELQNLQFNLQAFELKDYTCRDIVSFVGVLLKRNFRFNRAGYLESFWYTNNAQKTNAGTRVAGATFEDYHVAVTGVSLEDAQGNVHVAGTDDYLVELKSNPLVQDSAQAGTLASELLDVLSGLSYVPYKARYVGDPSWQAGDLLTHVMSDGSTIVSPIMEHTLTFRGTSQLGAVGKAPEQVRQLTSAAKILQELKLKLPQDLNQSLSSMEQTILNQSALITNALGFYPKIDRNPDGSIAAYYLMSTPESTAETTVWAFTSGGIGVSHTGIAGPYTSSWTADDSIVAQVITASMIKAGILQSRDGGATFYLDLDNGILRMDASEVLIGSKNVAETLNEMQGNTGSLSSRVEELANDTNDRLSGLESSLALKVDSSAVEVQITEALKNGATKVDTTTGIRMDSSGVTVDKTGASTSTNINENGMLVSRKTGSTLEAVLTANDQGVDAINLTARQYLIIGTRSRFENYGDDRTGCFWIG